MTDKSKILVELNPDLEEYVSNVAGGPPENFNELVAEAGKLNELAGSVVGLSPNEDVEQDDPVFERLRDIMLIAAYFYSTVKHGGRGEHPTAFVQRAKQIVKWCTRPIVEQTPLAILENKSRELARMIAQRLFHGDEFVLVIANSGEGGSMTWISSIDRNTTITLLDEFVGNMKADQKKRS